MKMNGWIRQSLGVALVAAGVGMANGPALAADYPNFTVDEGYVTDAIDQQIIADRLNGLYTEIFTPTFLTANSGTFTADATFNISAYYENDVLVPAQLGCGIGSLCYNLYALMDATGTFSIDGSGNVTFTASTASVELWLDPDQIAGNSDDELLASSSTLVFGEGHFFPGVSNGDFEIIWTALLLTSPEGESFFISPDPFYFVVDANGNFTENPLEQSPVSGSANAFFAVPEPGTLFLLGIALLGAGFASRRRDV